MTPRSALFVVISALAWPGLSAGQASVGRDGRPAPIAGQPTAPAPTSGRFRVCADPMNLPFSNDKLQGFENRIAALIARDFGATPSYVWWGQRQGFIRNTMNATLAEGRCDFVMGVPEKYDLVATTPTYYRSTYVFVYPKGKGRLFKTLDDPALKKAKIGVHLLGDDYANPPPVHALGTRHIVDNVVGFRTFYSSENPESAIIDALAAGTIDVAIVWGPIAGYYASRQKVPMEIVPVPSSPGDLPFSFAISMGVKKGNDAAKAKLEQVLIKRRDEIAAILKEYGVPIVTGPSTPTKRAAVAGQSDAAR